MKKLNLLKQHKILMLLFELSEGKKKNLKFEDIVVALFKKFPKDFHLKGYSKFPDSGDSIKRPLYTFRDTGVLKVRNMIFTLTDKGIEMGEKLKKQIGKSEIITEENFDRYIEIEINRIKNLESFRKFIKGKHEEILDTNLFDYLGTSVKAERMDFKSRINIMNEVAKVLQAQKGKLYSELLNFHNFVVKKFKKEINYKLKK